MHPSLAQITRYKKGGFYKISLLTVLEIICQNMIIQTMNFYTGHVRKLSMSVMLNDNFDGGAFEFASYLKEKCDYYILLKQPLVLLLFFRRQWNIELHL